MINLIAQNIDIFSGDGKHRFARTGQIGCFHLKKAGATGLILGHSEIMDAAQIVNFKWKELLGNGMQDNIILVGDDWEDLPKGWDQSTNQEKEAMQKKIKNKLAIIIDGIASEIVEKTIFGYEPSWGTRGSGKDDVLPPQPVQIGVMCGIIKETIKNLTGMEAGVIYGGRMSSERAGQITALDSVDGLILGSAAISTQSILEIARMMEKAGLAKKQGRELILALNWKAS